MVFDAVIGWAIIVMVAWALVRWGSRDADEELQGEAELDRPVRSVAVAFCKSEAPGLAEKPAQPIELSEAS